MEQAITDMVRQCTAAMESMNTMMGGMGGMMDGASGAISVSGGPMMAGGGWPLALAALVGAALAVGLTLVIVLTRGRRAPSIPGNAREELDRRYARGEIERETYLQQRTDLAAGAGS